MEQEWKNPGTSLRMCTAEQISKCTSEERGYDMHARLNFDGEQFLMDYILNGTDKTPYQHYSKKVLDYLKANQPDWTLEGLYGHERVSPLKPTTGGNLRELAASLPYKVIAKGYTAATIADALRHKVTVEIANNPTYGSDASYTVALSDLGTQRLTLSYIPESAADDAVVNDYGSLFSSPAYLVRVKPVLRKAGATVAVGAGATLGEKQTLTLSFQAPTLMSAPVVNQITAGSYSAVVVQGIEGTGPAPSASMEKLRKNAELNELGQAALDDTFGQLLHSIGLLWFRDIKYERDFYATTIHVGYTQLPSELIVAGDLVVSYLFGIPRTAQRGLYTIDADTDTLAAAPLTNDTSRAKDFMQLAGLTGSAWEHLELDSVFGGPAASSVKLLRSAVQQGIPIYRIDGSNFGEIRPLLSLRAEDISDIENAVNAGKQVVVSQSEVQVDNYRGVGLIALDPVRGNGLYLISGGLAGGGRFQFSKQEWEHQVSNSPEVAALARQMIIVWAASLWDTPYGFGCKDPTQPPNAYCEEVNPPSRHRGIDCSGLVAWAYERVGYSHLKKDARGKTLNAAAQHAAMDFYPTREQVKVGDLIFFDNTYEKTDPPNGPGDDPLTHVGIVLNVVGGPVNWIAAQGTKGVNVYTFETCPGDKYPKCIRVEDFNSFGSVIKY